MDNPKDFLIWWFCNLMAAGAIAMGRVGKALWRDSDNEPEDATQAKYWRRRRWWVVFSEVSALPGFATLSIALQSHFGLTVVQGVLMSMGFGAVGIVLLLDAASYIFRKRLGLPVGVSKND